MKKILFVLLCALCFCACKKTDNNNVQHTYLITTWDNDSVYVKADSWNWHSTGIYLYSGDETQYVSRCKTITIAE